MEKFLGSWSETIKEIEKEDNSADNQQLSKWYMRYSEGKLVSNYKEILAENDPKKQKEMIEKLVKSMNDNSHKTGFFSSKQEIFVGGFGQAAFIMDDNEIYFIFFKKMKEVIDEIKQTKPIETVSEGFIIYHAIRRTEEEYFGKSRLSRDKRLHLLSPTYDEKTDSFPTPSISVLKGTGLAECVELAAVAHNLWLLAGVKSHYILSKDCVFKNIDAQYQNDAHAFNIVYYGNAFRVYDRALGNYGKLDGNPIQDLVEGKPVVLTGPNIKLEGIYANASKANLSTPDTDGE